MVHGYVVMPLVQSVYFFAGVWLQRSKVFSKAAVLVKRNPWVRLWGLVPLAALLVPCFISPYSILKERIMPHVVDEYLFRALAAMPVDGDNSNQLPNSTHETLVAQPSESSLSSYPMGRSLELGYFSPSHSIQLATGDWMIGAQATGLWALPLVMLVWFTIFCLTPTSRLPIITDSGSRTINGYLLGIHAGGLMFPHAVTWTFNSMDPYVATLITLFVVAPISMSFHTSELVAVAMWPVTQPTWAVSLVTGTPASPPPAARRWAGVVAGWMGIKTSGWWDKYGAWVIWVPLFMFYTGCVVLAVNIVLNEAKSTHSFEEWGYITEHLEGAEEELMLGAAWQQMRSVQHSSLLTHELTQRAAALLPTGGALNP